MTPRTSQLWLPSWATLQVLMMMLPFVGALGAHLSSRAGGSLPESFQLWRSLSFCFWFYRSWDSSSTGSR